jgi:tyrosyl-DNA phosphodiesterase-1
MVIAASYCWEMDWLQEHLPDPKLVPTIFFTQPTPESNGKVRQADEFTEGFGQGSIVSTAYLPGNFGCQHMKFLLLFFRRRLRVIVTSANLRSADWLLMNNVSMVQDEVQDLIK